MGHDHSHHHHTPPESFNTAFALAVGLNLVFIIIEVFYALMANSMGLLADAVHNFGDVLGLILAWVANWLLTKPASKRYSYGYRRTSILAALMNAVLLVATSAIIAYESIQKLIYPEIVDEKIVIVIAFIGILINGGTAMLFFKGRSADLNIKGAFLHLAADALISIGVVVAGVIILYTGWMWLDPVVGLLIVATILLGTWGLLRDSVSLIMDAVPYGIDENDVRQYFCKLSGVTAVHDLHIWGLSTKENALTVHLVMPKETLDDNIYKKINGDLLHQFNIHHVTIQVEQGTSDHPCVYENTC